MKRVCKWIAVALIFIGFMFLLGTAGSSDIGTIDATEAFIRCLCGLGISGVGMIATYIIEKKENA